MEDIEGAYRLRFILIWLRLKEVRLDWPIRAHCLRLRGGEKLYTIQPSHGPHMQQHLNTPVLYACACSLTLFKVVCGSVRCRCRYSGHRTLPANGPFLSPNQFQKTAIHQQQHSIITIQSNVIRELFVFVSWFGLV